MKVKVSSWFKACMVAATDRELATNQEQHLIDKVP